MVGVEIEVENNIEEEGKFERFITERERDVQRQIKDGRSEIIKLIVR